MGLSRTRIFITHSFFGFLACLFFVGTSLADGADQAEIYCEELADSDPYIAELCKKNNDDAGPQIEKQEHRPGGPPDEDDLKKCREQLATEDDAALDPVWAEPYRCFYIIERGEFKPLSEDWDKKPR